MLEAIRTHARGHAGEHCDSAGRCLRRIAERSARDQSASIDRVEHHVGANRGIDRGVQLRLIVDAVQTQAACEIDQRLLLAQRSQHADRGLQRGQLPVGIEQVELGIVLTECGAGIRGHELVRILFLHDDRLDDFDQLVAIVA